MTSYIKKEMMSPQSYEKQRKKESELPFSLPVAVKKPCVDHFLNLHCTFGTDTCQKFACRWSVTYIHYCKSQCTITHIYCDLIYLIFGAGTLLQGLLLKAEFLSSKFGNILLHCVRFPMEFTMVESREGSPVGKQALHCTLI